MPSKAGWQAQDGGASVQVKCGLWAGHAVVLFVRLPVMARLPGKHLSEGSVTGWTDGLQKQVGMGAAEVSAETEVGEKCMGWKIYSGVSGVSAVRYFKHTN